MKDSEISHKYDDIIDLEYPGTIKGKPKAIVDRAAQFSPFAALTGHDAAVEETARLTDVKIELDENEKAELDLKIRQFLEQFGDEPVTITYFEPDELKSGGAYLTEHGRVRKFDEYTKSFLMQSGQRISTEDIIAFVFEHQE